MQASWSELAIGYVTIGLLVVGLPLIFFIVAFLPGLMWTTGEHLGESQQSKTSKASTMPSAERREIRSEQAGQRAKKPFPKSARNFANTT
jgi:hypothetical protein